MLTLPDGNVSTVLTLPDGNVSICETAAVMVVANLRVMFIQTFDNIILNIPDLYLITIYKT